MNCPFCGSADTQVKDSRPTDDGSAIRRRRFCTACSQRFTTVERVQLRELTVVKSDGRRVLFDRDKLARSIRIALNKRPVQEERVERVVNAIVRQLEAAGDPDITSTAIGELVMQTLKDVDTVAYVRFASVYRDFREASDFGAFRRLPHRTELIERYGTPHLLSGLGALGLSEAAAAQPLRCEPYITHQAAETVRDPVTDSAMADFFQNVSVEPPFAKLASRQSQLAQYLTPDSVANFMAGLFSPLPASIRLLDAGAGAGALTAAFASRWRQETSGAGKIVAHAYELDGSMLDLLRKTTDQLVSEAGIVTEVIEGDFIAQAATMLRLERGPRYTHAIMNPPYKKINSNSDHRSFLRAAGLETVNLYSGFLGLAVALLEQGGEIVAIVPRSFCNGPYYLPFRRFVLARAAIQHIHLFEARNKAFKDDGVLQENIVIRLTRGAKQGKVTISTSTDDVFDDYRETKRPFSNIVAPGDANQFIHIPTGDEADLLNAPAFRFSLDQLGLSVSTGPIVDFRMREDLRADPEPGTVPLLYPGHFSHDRMVWPKPGFRKANAITHSPQTHRWLFPSGFYTVVRRFSSKEERRRIVANVVEPAILEAEMIGFENHLNVLHQGKKPLEEDIARGLAIYLNCTAVDRHFRRFNGNTQVNAADLRIMPYPDRPSIVRLAQWARKNPLPSQEAIDARVADLA